MKKLHELMKDTKEVKMPEHRSKARLQLIKAMKSLAKDLMMEELQSKLGAPDAVAVQVGVSAEPEMMSKDEAMDADMDMFREKEAALLLSPKMDMEESEDEESEEESEESGDDMTKLKMLLKQKKSQDSEY